MKIPLLLSLIAGVSTVIGSILIFFKYKKINRLIVISLSFSLAIMTLISVFDLLPDSSMKLINNYGGGYGLVLIILTFLLGYLSIEKINNRIKTNNNSSLYKIGVLSMISLMFHNFPEGIAVFMGAYTNIHLGLKLCLAIMLHNIPEGITTFISTSSNVRLGITLSIAIALHNIPEGISIAVPIYFATGSHKRSFWYTLLSGFSELLGAVLAYLFIARYVNNFILSLILGVTAGIMIHISAYELLPNSLAYKKRKDTILSFLLGVLVMFVCEALL